MLTPAPRRLCARALLLLGLASCGGSDDDSTSGATALTSASSSGGSATSDATDPGTAATSTSDATGDATTGSDSDAGSGSDSEAASDTETETDATTGPQPSEDELLFRSAIAGELDPAEALDVIADRGGLPVETLDGAFLFGCLCGPGGWQVAGDHDGWRGTAMARTGDLSWAELAIPAADGSRYKFHDGGDAWIADPRGRRHDYDQNGAYSLVRSSARHLERWYGLAGFGLGPRDLEVLVPEDGAFTHALYAHDGQNLFDPEAIWGGWQLEGSAPPELLIVGIENTPARIDEYTHVPDDIGDGPIGGDGDAYAALVDELVRPRMEDAYGEAAVVGVMGSSLGGLVAFHIADRYPGRYDMAISMSGTMGWGSIGPEPQPGATMIERYAAAGKRSTALYLDSGGGGSCLDADDDGVDDDGDANDNYCENLQLRDVLVGLGYTYDVDLWHWHEPGAPHNEAAWAARVGAPLAIFAGL